MATKTTKKKTTKKKTTKKKAVKELNVSARPPRADTEELFEQLQANLGRHGVLIQRGTDLEGRFDLRRPCGIPSLDIDTGGGLPAGGLSQIDGPDGSGKNMLAYRYCGRIQQLYGSDTNIFMLCMEFPFDKDYAAHHGFKVPYSKYEVEVRQRARKEEGLEPYTKEEVAEMMSTEGRGTFHILRGSAEANLDAVVEMIRSNAYQIGVIDSWDSMLTAPEEETDLADDPRIANASSVQTKWMKKVQGALVPRKRCPVCFDLNVEHKKYGSGSYSYVCTCGWKGKTPFLEENETSVIGIRQVRANLRRMNMRSREYKVGGAWALKHGKLVDIQLRPGENLTDKSGKTKIGKDINYEITKGKAGTHEGKKGLIRYFFGPPEVDVDHNYYTTALSKGIIRRGGSYYYIDCDGEPLRYNGQRELLDALADEPEIRTLLWKLLLKQAGLHHIRHKDLDDGVIS